MKRKAENTVYFILLVLLTALIAAAADIIVIAMMLPRWNEDASVSSQAVIDGLIREDGGYALPEDITKKLAEKKQFVMMIDNGGRIIWSEFLPPELDRIYTMQDVARFTRYYLDGYPVRTYVVPEGLLIIGGRKDSIWKYNLEYGEGSVRKLLKCMPLILLSNVLMLIGIPLLIQRKRLRLREAERTEWIAGVSHDIRTPLTLILGSARNLAGDNGTAPDTCKTVGEKAALIEAQALRIRSLITNLNTSNRLCYGIGAYSRSELSICPVLRKAVSDAINRAADGRYTISLDIDDTLQSASIKANEELFIRMAENLINNSVVHNPGGCDIEVSLRPAGVGKCLLTVADNGTGAPAEKLAELNEKAADYRVSGSGEHGIGLRLVRQIAGYHSWKLRFADNEPRGFRCGVQMN